MQNEECENRFLDSTQIAAAEESVRGAEAAMQDAQAQLAQLRPARARLLRKPPRSWPSTSARRVTRSKTSRPSRCIAP